MRLNHPYGAMKRRTMGVTTTTLAISSVLFLSHSTSAFVFPELLSQRSGCCVEHGKRRRAVVHHTPLLQQQQRQRPSTIPLYSISDPQSSLPTPDNSSGDKLDECLSRNSLKEAIQVLRSNPALTLNRSRFLKVFDTIEVRTRAAEENFRDDSQQYNMETQEKYPPVSPARMEMTDMYDTLKQLDHLRIYGAAGNNNYPAAGSKTVTPTLLEQISKLSMTALTPKPTNTFLIAGIAFAILEGITSLVTGIDINVFIIGTIIFALMDNLIVNGAIFETAQKLILPEYRKKVLKHEAGHFLVAYLLGCPVEGCVLSTWAALKDERFGGPRTGVSAGTSFFDPQLSDQVNGKAPLSRSSIDRYSTIVMAGIAAEAIHFGQADGGAGDEMALIRFLSDISPRGGGATSWNTEGIKNQARWGALQSVMLLRHYKPSYEALVDALERGGDLGQCVYAIENAAREDDTEILTNPLGNILDRGLYGEWTEDIIVSTGPTVTTTVVTEADVTTRTTTEKESVVPVQRKEVLTAPQDPEILLKDTRELLEQKLKDIEDKIAAMEKAE